MAYLPRCSDISSEVRKTGTEVRNYVTPVLGLFFATCLTILLEMLKCI